MKECEQLGLGRQSDDKNRNASCGWFAQLRQGCGMFAAMALYGPIWSCGIFGFIDLLERAVTPLECVLLLRL